MKLFQRNQTEAMWLRQQHVASLKIIEQLRTDLYHERDKREHLQGELNDVSKSRRNIASIFAIIVLFMAALFLFLVLITDASAKDKKYDHVKRKADQAVYHYDANGNLLGTTYKIDKNLTPQEKANRRNNIQRHTQPPRRNTYSPNTRTLNQHQQLQRQGYNQ